ncbi:MAG: 3-oxoacyl-[acyl-carrier-protein] reductase FabG [Pseudomonadota bacterium]|jgi:NAD(P)-dependent dehydrogenase (short-subunit alcohol dehydrogenase family)
MPRVALVTHAQEFLGPPAVLALRAAGLEVVALDSAQSGPADVADAVATTLEAYGALDVCVMNSAFPAERAPIHSLREDRMRAAYEALVFGPMRLAQAVAPHMTARRSGKLIFCTSAAPLRGLSNYSVYVGARGAMNAATRSLALELAPHNVQVNAVAPNFIESETYFPKALMDDPAARAKILGNIPLGRLGRPEEAGALIAYLASPAADFVTGQVIPLAGGWA